MALCATEPPVALSHVPLRTVPPTAINVHGHLHGNPAPTPRHVNVSVEQTDYTPVRLDQVLERFPEPAQGLVSCVMVHPDVPGDRGDGEAAITECRNRRSNALVDRDRPGFPETRLERQPRRGASSFVSCPPPLSPSK